jgi:hypothetical protein
VLPGGTTRAPRIARRQRSPLLREPVEGREFEEAVESADVADGVVHPDDAFAFDEPVIAPT